MSSSLFGLQNLNNDIKFINKRAGGKNDDSDEILKTQLDVIKSINLEHDFKTNTNDNNNTNYRINNSKTILDEKVNISNPSIIPEKYDLYFNNYLFNKNLNTINNRIIQQYNYVNIDSRIVQTYLNSNYFTLEKNPLTLKNNVNILYIKVQDSILQNFKIGDKITLQGITPPTTSLNVSFTFTTYSSIVKTSIPFNYLYNSKFSNSLIEFKNIIYPSDYFYNIPTNALNNTFNSLIHENQLSFKLPFEFYSTNPTETFTSYCTVLFNSIGNIQITYLNAYQPFGKYNLTSYHTITNIENNTIEVNIPEFPCLIIPSLNFGDTNIQIGNITETFINSNYEYLYEFNKKFFNVASIKIISSEINIYSTDNKNITITTKNNKFYWSFFNENTETYNITIRSGVYSYDSLKTYMQDEINNKLQNKQVELNFNSSSLYFTFKFLNVINNPLCLVGLTITGTTYQLKIYYEKHTLDVGDEIVIKNSLDYYTLSKDYINQKHIITLTEENYIYVDILYVNPITDVGNTYGGNGIIIISPISAKLYFNYENTIGEELYFLNVGSDYAITPFSSKTNDYTITNQQPYLYNISPDFTFDNFNLNTSYVLLKIEGLNFSYNPFNENYFYKFQTQKTILNDVLFNTFVDAPLYCNPPLEELQRLRISFISPTGTPLNFKIFNYSLTLEIVTIQNASENTHINTQIGRI